MFPSAMLARQYTLAAWLQRDVALIQQRHEVDRLTNPLPEVEEEEVFSGWSCMYHTLIKVSVCVLDTLYHCSRYLTCISPATARRGHFYT